MRADRALFKTFEKAGFTLVRCNNHAIWRCPCGHGTVVTSRTPSKGVRSIDNSLRDLRNCLEACKANGWKSAA